MSDSTFADIVCVYTFHFLIYCIYNNSAKTINFHHACVYFSSSMRLKPSRFYAPSCSSQRRSRLSISCFVLKIDIFADKFTVKLRSRRETSKLRSSGSQFTGRGDSTRQILDMHFEIWLASEHVVQVWLSSFVELERWMTKTTENRKKEKPYVGQHQSIIT